MSGLPPDVITHCIAPRLPNKDLIILSLSCSYFNRLTKSELYKRRLKYIVDIILERVYSKLGDADKNNLKLVCKYFKKRVKEHEWKKFMFMVKFINMMIPPSERLHYSN